MACYPLLQKILLEDIRVEKVEISYSDDNFTRFINQYFSCVRKLIDENNIDKIDLDLFNEWFNEKGKFLLYSVQKYYYMQIIDLSKLEQILNYYSFFLDDSTLAKDYEQLLDWLYEIPTTLKNRLVSLIEKADIFKFNDTYYQFIDSFISYNPLVTVEKPAEMQVL